MSQRGAATVLTVAMAGVLLLTGAAAGVVGALVVAHRRAQAAADLAALASATSLATGGATAASPGPCAAAVDIARANGARLVSCWVDDLDVTVEVRVPGPRWLGQTHDLSATARAGPATARGP
ncbi:Rv3654c family TadE-like protein [Nocardioides nitrophenolicus]|uniref:Rv3654c family TadE-like protein n=1 Tax=Nocardioides nitrophenolicus TaxID=60489 RepID=UPI00195F0C08|nr:Rv3654c family TadE-like protein [Nocardioides nitrophenolicus]MBM7517230.1 secretion/DNA translocation related TadE-like protein [Nocardioides nitrophenolicus]